ncbi:MAG: hypothetical protein U0269_09205 [Polyangiales bacterium]
MDERRPYAPAEQTAAPTFNATASGLATVDSARAASDVPKGFSASERRDAAGYSLESQRTTRSFALSMLWPSILLLWVIGGAVASLRTLLDGEWGGALALMLVLVAPVVPFVHRLVRRSFDAARITLSAEGVRADGGLLTITDVGVTSVALGDIFGFAVQNEGSSKTRVMVLTRDGEAKLLRCNVLDRAHAIFVVTRLNRELSAMRAAGHYRG